MEREKTSNNLTNRRGFLKQVGTASASVVAIPTFFDNDENDQQEIPNQKEQTLLNENETSIIQLTINGESLKITVDNRTTLLDLLREKMDLIGTKKGCNHGACGACTVHIGGKNANSCLQLAAFCDQAEITTIEGLEKNGTLHPMQEAFIENDGFQCGYCTSGQIMTAVTVAKEKRVKDKNGIRELMSGNLCRCGAYNGICDSVHSVINS